MNTDSIRNLSLVVSTTLVLIFALWVLRDLALADKIEPEAVAGLIGSIVSGATGFQLGRMSAAGAAPADTARADGDFDTSDLDET